MLERREVCKVLGQYHEGEETFRDISTMATYLLKDIFQTMASNFKSVNLLLSLKVSPWRKRRVGDLTPQGAQDSSSFYLLF